VDIKALSEKYNDYIIRMRREFHQHPELSWEEDWTTDKIEKELKDIGLKTERFESKTGVVAYLEGGKAGKTIALRADIDALPIEEHTELPFKSINKNMHACGHDCHTAMLLGAVKILAEIKDELNGNIKFIFQAAEETCHAAEYYVEQGILEGVDAIFGIHIWGTLDAPKINFEQGGRMASCDNFKITVRGKAAHGSAPHLGQDAVVAAASIIMNLQTYVSRKNNPLNPLVISIGTIHGGNRFNIIADKVEMEGTIRTFSKELRGYLEKDLRNIIENTAKALEAETEFEYSYYPSPVINDERLAEIAKKASMKLYGEESLVSMDRLMGSEDFAYFMDVVPGVYGFLGCRNEAIGAIYSNHSDKFTVDEDVLKRGAALYAQFAVDFLED